MTDLNAPSIVQEATFRAAIIQYAPANRGELLNIGVMSKRGAVTAVQFLDDWTRVLRAFPRLDVRHLTAVAAEVSYHIAISSDRDDVYDVARRAVGVYTDFGWRTYVGQANNLHDGVARVFQQAVAP